ncbi:MAG: hypothetical protein LBC99_05945 [Spirochaetota bacterium]|nr:hypothetical protein [Spirochaetota bacterium]
MKKKMCFIISILIGTVSIISAQQTAKIQTGGQFKVMEVKEFISNDIFRKPDVGMRNIAFDIVIDNINGTGDINFNPYFHSVLIRDTDGRTYRPGTEYYYVKPTMPYRIEVGELARGWITVAIPINVSLAGCRIRLDAEGDQFNRITSDWIAIKL